jgi:hypothetical protein
MLFPGLSSPGRIRGSVDYWRVESRGAAWRYLDLAGYMQGFIAGNHQARILSDEQMEGSR